MNTGHEEFHKQLVAALDDENESQLHHLVEIAPAADIAESFELLSDEDRSRVLFAVPAPTAAEIIVMLDEAVRGDVVDELDTASLTEIVSELQPDDAADVLGELDDDEIDAILGQLETSHSKLVGDLLEYDESTAGGIMTPDVVALEASATVADAAEQVRQANQAEDLHDVFVVDKERRLVGIVPLRRLVTAPRTTRLEQICDRKPVTVNIGDDQETVVQIIRKYDVSEAAVVDDAGRLIGRVTHDDVMDVAEEEAAEDLYRMAGTDPAELESSSIFNAARIRLIWLTPTLIGTCVSASVLQYSKPEFDLSLFAALLPFVPMIGAMGGNCGIQISTVIVREFATGDIGSTSFARALMREGRISLVIAPICGLFAWLLVTVIFPTLRQAFQDQSALGDNRQVALAVGCAMTLAILVAGGLGLALPFSFRRLGFDPAIASGPLITTLNDVVSVTIYMTAAYLIAA